MSAGYNVVGEAVNGHEGIDMAGKLKPDLVTVDFTMPEKGGLESLEEIQAAHPGAKVIAVTALGSQKLLQEDAKKAGAAAMIGKPFNPFELVRVADGLLGRQGKVSEPKGLTLPAGQAMPRGTSDGLTGDQIADLMEVGNIGAGNAASRLSDLIQRRCFISPPQVLFLKPGDVLKSFGTDDYFLVPLGIQIMGDIPAVMVMLLRREHLPGIIATMAGGRGKPGDVSAAARFALKQAGEFMTRAFSQAVNQFLLAHVQDSVPNVTISETTQDLPALLKDSPADEPYLLIHCGFSDDQKTFEGTLAYLLSSSSQQTVLKRLKSLLTKK